jgi:hypothetical protein
MIKKTVGNILNFISNSNTLGFLVINKLYKLIGRRSWPDQTYAQRAEDFFMGKLLGDVSNIKYMDIGAYHPFIFSNTWEFYQKGGKGINIDMSPDTIKIFNKLRPKDKNICASIGKADKTGTAYFLERNAVSLVNTLDPAVAQEWKNLFGKTPVEKSIDIFTLATIFKKYGINPSEIDVVSIDVEGMDEVVLAQWPFDQGSPRVFCVELHQDEITEVLNSKIHSIMTENGYRLAFWVHPSIIYMKR